MRRGKRKGGGDDPPPSPFSATDARRDIVIQTPFLENLQYWVRADPRIANRIIELVADVQRDPLRGKGKPERLKHELQGLWSRRITEEHRLVYRVFPTHVELLSARGHY